jgi:hypothetical protein
MSDLDWEPLDRDAGRPAARANRLLRAIQEAVEAHDAAAAAPPHTIIESRTEFGEGGVVRVRRRLRADDGTEVDEVLRLVCVDDTWRVVGIV